MNPAVRLRAGRPDDAVAIKHLYETVAAASGGIARTAAEVTLDYVTVAVHPDAQGQGIGRMLFIWLLDDVRRNHADILRVELVTQESNVRALRLYESLGFVREGRLEGRIRNLTGGVEADIPMAWHRGT